MKQLAFLQIERAIHMGGRSVSIFMVEEGYRIGFDPEDRVYRIERNGEMAETDASNMIERRWAPSPMLEPEPIPEPEPTEPFDVEHTGSGEFTVTLQKRGRGRPPGSKNRPKAVDA